MASTAKGNEEQVETNAINLDGFIFIFKHHRCVYLVCLNFCILEFQFNNPVLFLESSMGLEVITVRLNLETIPLGMTPSGHTNARGDAGLYVGDIQDRGAVALDGRIDIGDMIVGINEISLGNYSNKEAVQLLREAVQRQYLTLTIAKTGDPKQNAFPRNPRAEPIRPIDPNEWVKHATNAMKAMPSISEGEDIYILSLKLKEFFLTESSSTPIPDDWPTNSSASGTPFGGPPPANCLNVMTDKKYVVEVMAAPGSGLDIKDRYWFKIPIPMSFLGTDLVEWLVKHVQGLETKKKAREFAEEMLKLGYIRPGVGKQSFTKECYYVMGDECAGKDLKKNSNLKHLKFIF